MCLFFGCISPAEEAVMSGMVSRTGISGFVYVRKAVGMKFQRGSKEMKNAAYRKNLSRLDYLQKVVDSLAEQIKSAVVDFVKTSESEFEFDQIEDGYEFYTRDMSGYCSFPTLFSSEEAEEHAGEECYFLVMERPVVVLRFSKLPALNQLGILRTVVENASDTNN
jgi:hypothetical protein